MCVCNMRYTVYLHFKCSIMIKIEEFIAITVGLCREWTV